MNPPPPSLNLWLGGDAPEAPSHTRGVCVFVSSSSSSFVVVVVGGGGRVALRASRAARPHEEQRRAGAGCSALQQRGPACRGCVLARRVSRRVRPVRTPHGADPAKHRGGGTSPASPARCSLSAALPKVFPARAGLAEFVNYEIVQNFCTKCLLRTLYNRPFDAIMHCTTDPSGHSYVSLPHSTTTNGMSSLPLGHLLDVPVRR